MRLQGIYAAVEGKLIVVISGQHFVLPFFGKHDKRAGKTRDAHDNVPVFLWFFLRSQQFIAVDTVDLNCFHMVDGTGADEIHQAVFINLCRGKHHICDGVGGTFFKAHGIYGTQNVGHGFDFMESRRYDAVCDVVAGMTSVRCCGDLLAPPEHFCIHEVARSCMLRRTGSEDLS